jgi:1-acyl-sn-glycerol-3-phosphate acyltransferase
MNATYRERRPVPKIVAPAGPPVRGHCRCAGICIFAAVVIVRRVLSAVWKIWLILWFAVPFLLLFPLFYRAMKRGRHHVVFSLKRLWARIITTGVFLFPRITYRTGKYKMPEPCVIVCNHTSYLDIVLTPFFIDHTAVFMAKHELMRIPLFGLFFKYFDIPVNRRSMTGSHKAFQDAAAKIDQGLSVIIYPEGTISNEGKLKPFKNGAFKLAIEKQVPVIPVVNLNNWWFLQNGGFFKSNGRPGIPRIIVGQAIETKGMDEKNTNALRDKVFTFINDELEAFYGSRH